MEQKLDNTQLPEEIKIPLVQWESYGKGSDQEWVGFDGDKIIAIIAKPKGFPCDMYQFQYIDQGYTTLEAAKKIVEKDRISHIKHVEYHKENSMLKTIQRGLKTVLGELDKSIAAHNIDED